MRTRGSAISLVALLLAGVLAVSCDLVHEEAILEEPSGPLAPVVTPTAVHASVAPTPTLLDPEPAPAPRPPPAPDPEEIARRRAEAAREAFEREYPWHGVAYHFLAQVYDRADASSPVIGYMRRGSQFRSQPTVRGPGCRQGWARVPGAGYVCRGEGFKLGLEPQTFDPSPIAAATDNALPYAYGWVARDDVPQFWNLPTPDDEAAARAWIARRVQRESEASETEEPAVEPDNEAPPGLDADAAEAEEEAPPASAPAAPSADPDEMPAALRMHMRRGFYVSIDRLEQSGERRFYRTVRGAYVPADAIAEASPPTLRGVVLGGRWRLPVGFVYRGGVRTLARDPATGRLRMADPVDRFVAMPLGEELITRGQQRYRASDRGRIVREDAMRIARPIERPEGVRADQRWIHVDLSDQVLVAYEGDRPVFATLVSTGREGFSTPTGTFRIQSKHVSTTMDDPEAGAEAYSIEDVPWTMYFEGSYALHAAFWHSSFGRVRSHGCVNLAPADARWIFMWTLPELPDGFHGISASRTRPGTIVHITD
ncbi:MAG: L,D-transpeptidase [Sandaracinaceae bacterium]